MNNDEYDFYKHPLFDELQLLIDTPAVKSLYELIQQWIWVGATGAFVKGEPRVGKSFALKAISNKLMTRDNNIVPLHRVTMHRRDVPTIRSVHNALCISADLKVSVRATSDVLSDNFMHYILDMVRQHGVNRFVLFVDEAQRLKSWQFDAFAELYDQLRDPFGISLLVIFVANDPECNALIEEMNDESHAHIRGRFFTLIADFMGLRSEKEVGYCLSQYDSLRWPNEDGLFYTEYFLSEYFSNGWRLSSLSRSLWGNFREYQKMYHLKSWGMKYFISTVNILLTDLIPHYGISEVSDGMIQEAIKLSGIIPSQVRDRS